MPRTTPPPEANPEHAKAILTGKSAWRAWRKVSTETPDLRGLTLVGLDLSSLDLSGADLRKADLSQSNLRRTRLMGAKLDACRARISELGCITQ